MVQIITPTTVETHGLETDYYGHPRMNKHGTLSPSTWRGKQLIFGLPFGPSFGIYPKVFMESCITSYDSPFLYVAPESNISRDALRNSGYHIVRDKEKAKCVVVPKMQQSAELGYNIAAVCAGYVGLFSLGDDPIGVTKDLVDKFLELIQNYVKARLSSLSVKDEDIQLIYDDTLVQKSAFVIPKCDSYADLWSCDGDSDSRPRYCFDNNVRLTPSVEVNPELFSIWDKCKDIEIIACAMTQCDWQKYPITLASYLYENHSRIKYNVNNYQAYVLRQIGFYEFYDKGTCSRTVEPEDWNMLQKCKMHLLGLPEDGGYINMKSPDTRLSGLPHRIYVKPMYITEPARYKDLMEAVKNK